MEAGNVGHRWPGIRSVWLALAVLACCIGALAAPAYAAAGPVWDLTTRWGPTNVAPGGEAEFVINARNFGDAPTDGTPVTIELELPPEMSALSADRGTGPANCAGLGTSKVTCTVAAVVMPRMGFTSGSIPGGPWHFVSVSVAPGAVGPLTVTSRVSGGGAAPAVDVDRIPITNELTSFGLLPDATKIAPFDAEAPHGDQVAQAGSHPFELRVDFEANLTSIVGKDGKTTTVPVGDLRTIENFLPRGMIGNPEALPKCSAADFLSPSGNIATGLGTNCPPETQVGVINIDLNGAENGRGLALGYVGHLNRVPVYNLEPPPGQAVDFGFPVMVFYQGHIYSTVDPERDYTIKSTAPSISSLMSVRGARFTAWGVPGDPAHDNLRFNPKTGFFGASSTAPIRPLLTLSSECGVLRRGSMRAESWQNQGIFRPAVASTMAQTMTGCADPRFRFKPSIRLAPTSRSAGGPTGLTVNLVLPQRDQTVSQVADLYPSSDSLHAIDTPPIKKAEIVLPVGMTISASAAQGLGNCSSEQIGLGTSAPVRCPENSRYGSVTLRTPILPANEPMHGSVFIAKQNDNPYNSFLALYLVIEDSKRGLQVKIPARVELDPATGRIRTMLDDLPQFPVSDMQLQFKGGVRAALVNPTTCGRKAIKATFYSWHDPQTPISSTSSYDVTHEADGSACVNALGQRQFRPKFKAGSMSPSAGTFSTFSTRIQRDDGDQEFSRLNVDLPQGMLARIAGTTRCSDASIAAAEAPGRKGATEVASPSCPASSQLGTTDVGSGVGEVITYLDGKAYLAGPYRGAPLSLVVITPVMPGPYDLGVIAVRSAIHVDRETAKVSIRTNALPQIFEGIPVRIRDIRVKADRPDTMLNPTNCNPTAVTGQIFGTGEDAQSLADDLLADVMSRFQVANCRSLRFGPKLTFRLKGGTRRGAHPRLVATVKARRGDANIARTTVTLPHSLFLEQSHIRTVCTRVQFAADACPRGSIYGRAEATSPLFDEKLSGPVYLRSSNNLLPDLVISLNGEIDVVLSSRIDSFRRGIRNTFQVVPDAPVTRFTLRMQGGKKGLLVNSRNLCRKGAGRARVRMVGQNGKDVRTRPKVRASCKRGRR